MVCLFAHAVFFPLSPSSGAPGPSREPGPEKANTGERLAALKCSCCHRDFCLTMRIRPCWLVRVMHVYLFPFPVSISTPTSSQGYILYACTYGSMR